MRRTTTLGLLMALAVGCDQTTDDNPDTVGTGGGASEATGGVSAQTGGSATGGVLNPVTGGRGGGGISTKSGGAGPVGGAESAGGNASGGSQPSGGATMSGALPVLEVRSQRGAALAPQNVVTCKTGRRAATQLS